MKTGYVSIDTVVADFLEDFDTSETELDEELIKKWANDAVKDVSTDEQLIPKIGHYTVKNYKVELPNDMELLCEVACRLEKPKDCNLSRRETISQWTQWADNDCELEINLKCQKCTKVGCTGCGDTEVIVDVDRMWELSNAHFNYPLTFGNVKGFGKGDGNKKEDYCFRTIQCADSHWAHIRKHINSCVNLCCGECEHTYMLNLPNIEVNFEKGELLIAYLARPTDGDGNLLVPDNQKVFRAIQDYVAYRYVKKNVYKIGKDPKQIDIFLLRDAKNEWIESLSEARSAMQIPDANAFNKWFRNNNTWFNAGRQHLDKLEGRSGRRKRGKTGRLI